MYDNKVKIEFLSKSVNEGFARVAVAAFIAQLDPTIEELNDVKTAVSEAVTNSIIHGYENREDGIIKIEASIFRFCFWRQFFIILISIHFFTFFFHYFINNQLLNNLQNIACEPIKQKSSWCIVEHKEENQRHSVHHKFHGTCTLTARRLTVLCYFSRKKLCSNINHRQQANLISK